MKEEISKKRREIPNPKPVLLKGIYYESVPWGKARGLGQNGGFIRAVDKTTGSEKWLLKVYDVVYKKDMEDDKQDVFISELYMESECLLHVVNERERHYLVNIDKQTVTELKV
ncbi:hypothetical protein BAC3_00190 [uncultured bacterium]|nr:hypothetical protein BAC3_00190 [uncultured bacterium]